MPKRDETQAAAEMVQAVGGLLKVKLSDVKKLEAAEKGKQAREE
ncbi:MAG TPA: hypothetical protein VIM11_08290 [Tepidisphaeraceae bacterium]|jgi:hypothetical protein